MYINWYMKGVMVGSLWVFVVVVLLIGFSLQGVVLSFGLFGFSFVCLFVFVNLTQLSFLGRESSIEKMLSLGHKACGTSS